MFLPWILRPLLYVHHIILFIWMSSTLRQKIQNFGLYDFGPPYIIYTWGEKRKNNNILAPILLLNYSRYLMISRTCFSFHKETQHVNTSRYSFSIISHRHLQNYWLITHYTTLTPKLLNVYTRNLLLFFCFSTSKVHLHKILRLLPPPQTTHTPI